MSRGPLTEMNCFVLQENSLNKWLTSVPSNKQVAIKLSLNLPWTFHGSSKEYAFKQILAADALCQSLSDLSLFTGSGKENEIVKNFRLNPKDIWSIDPLSPRFRVNSNASGRSMSDKFQHIMTISHKKFLKLCHIHSPFRTKYSTLELSVSKNVF